ncbi:MAG: 50S ribosomal protein L2 [Methylacidiphilales bacterium]|nr:50S ribosomal protein L2 [Candidatus Methylacidiphilales bacterium]
MSLYKLRPTSPGARFVIRVKNTDLNKDKPHKPLLSLLHKQAGRNNYGRITVRHQGGGNKRFYREIDFIRTVDNCKAVVETIEYDPNRSARIARICYANGKRSYIIATEQMKKGVSILNGPSAPISDGNCLPLSSIPLGTQICCVEMKFGKGAQIARSAGSVAQLLSRDDQYVTIKLKSGFVIKINSNCRAVIGTVSNFEHNLRKLGKAGASRWRGIRPTVRGVVMNPVDHPHGGGEGKTSGGRHPVTPWGKKTKGLKTRKVKRTNSTIVSRKVK